MIGWEEIGERIKFLRNGKNLTQEQFGKLVGKSTQYIGRIERGQKMSVELIADICKETGVTTDYLILGVVDSCDMDFLDDFSSEQIEIFLDILKRATLLIKSPNGNRLLIKELMRRQVQPIAV